MQRQLRNLHPRGRPCEGRPTCRKYVKKMGRKVTLSVSAKLRDFQREVVVGIDLGTTNSAVAYVEGGKPKCIPNEHGETITPSVVSVLKDGKQRNGGRTLLGNRHPQKEPFLDKASAADAQ